MLSLLLDRLHSPVGHLRIVVDHDGALRAVDWDDDDSRLRAFFARHHGRDGFRFAAGRDPAGVTSTLARYFDGDIRAIDAIPVVMAGTSFQRRVWTALRAIQGGTTTSYGELARCIDQPRAVRAVGLANGSNPIPIVVPCHRVIGARGQLVGYGGGLERKRWLLAHERSDLLTVSR
jgi:methylated-DNA-[protein]-cysteine S-methyltransferase